MSSSASEASTSTNEPAGNATTIPGSSPPMVPIATNKNKVAYVSPGVVDSEGFLAPPPASTLLIRRTRTNSSGSSTYVIASSSPSAVNSYEGNQDGTDPETLRSPDHYDSPSSLRNTINSALFHVGNQSVSPLVSLESHTNSITPMEASTSSTLQANPNYPTLKIPKLYLKKINVHDGPGGMVVKKRGPRGKYNKERKKINIDVLTGKRRYTRRKLLRLERTPIENDSSSEKGDNECESDDSSCEIKPCLSDNGIWRPTDDLRLICNVSQTANLEYVHIGVKFSNKYTLEEITERWDSLLNDEKISHVSQTAIKNLHPLVKQRIQNQVLFSDTEEDLLKTVNEAAVGNPDIKIFQKLLDENKEKFYKIRTPHCLFKHWLCLRELNLLDAQKERGTERFESFELSLDVDELVAETSDKTITRELIIASRNTKRKIRILEKEVKNLQNIMENLILKDTIVKTDSINSFATLKGAQVQYLMRSQEITFGRRTSHNFVDADIQLEGSANHVSRMQGKIALEENGEFNIYNFGRNIITVNSKPLRPYTKRLIDDQAIIMIGKLSFIFEVNKPIIHYIRRMYYDKIKSHQQSIQKKTQYVRDISKDSWNENVNENRTSSLLLGANGPNPLVSSLSS